MHCTYTLGICLLYKILNPKKLTKKWQVSQSINLGTLVEIWHLFTCTS